MPTEVVDPRWPKLLSLTVHEFRTPMTVVSGYLRMLLKERAGPVSEQQKRLLEEAEKSCSRLSSLLAEVSELSALEGGTAAFNPGTLELSALLGEAIAALPPLPDREVHIDLQAAANPASIRADASRLRTALTSIIAALRRELVTSNRLIVRTSVRPFEGATVSWTAIGDVARVDSLAEAGAAALATFDEWRGGCGLSLPVARRIISAHGGRIWSPVEDPKAGAAIAIPVV